MGPLLPGVPPEKKPQGLFQRHPDCAQQPGGCPIIPRFLGMLHCPFYCHCEEHWKFLSHNGLS